MFFSAAIAIGAMISLGSYNDFHTDFYKHTMIVAGINSGTSFLSGFAVFSVLGFMAHEQNVDIDQVAESGPGLVFIVYPKAVTMMPLPQLWAILFFLMLFLIGIDSGFVMVESVVAHISDMFPRQLYKDSDSSFVFFMVHNGAFNGVQCREECTSSSYMTTIQPVV